MRRFQLVAAIIAALLLGQTFPASAATTLAYSYNPDGSRSALSTPAGSIAYAYDGAGRPASLTDPSSNATGWTYGANSWLATQALPNGITAAFTYDAAGQLTRLTNATTSSTLTDYGGSGGMTYDGAGNRLSVPVTVTGSSSLSGTTSYSYSTLDQLTGESSTRSGGYSQTNVYDSAGNPTTLRSTSGLTYNSDNQSTADTFDGNGNPTTYNSTTLTFDSDNELTAYGTAITAGYGADGLRAWKNNGTATTYFLYDGSVPVCELNSSGTVTALNIFGPAGLISRTTSAGVTYYTFDANGSVAQRTDASGAAVSTDIYDGFGNGASAPPDPFGYGAQFGCYTDSETGLVLCGHRYYDPTTARWVTRDPIGYGGGMDLYAYCGDGPVGKADPSGLAGYDPEDWSLVKGIQNIGAVGFTGAIQLVQFWTAIHHAKPIAPSEPAPTAISRPFAGYSSPGGSDPYSAAPPGEGAQNIGKPEPPEPPDADTINPDDFEGTKAPEPIESIPGAGGEAGGLEGAADITAAGAGATVAVAIGSAAAVAWSGYEICKYRPGRPSGPLTGAGEFWSETPAGVVVVRSLSRLPWL